MWIDVLKLRAWYHSLQGRLVQRVVRRSLQPMLPDPARDTATLGLGYCQPYLHPPQKNDSTVLAMPENMGGTPWPEGKKNRVVLTGEDLPFPDNTFDCIVLCHHLEFSPDADALMEACFHALRPDGQLVVMVPNRAGAWARRDTTILAQGHPYSAGQLEKLFTRNHFKTTQSEFALFFPPVNWRPLLRFYETFEKIGRRWRAPVGGVIVAQASKDVFGMKVVGSKKRQSRRLVQVPAGVAELRKNK